MTTEVQRAKYESQKTPENQTYPSSLQEGLLLQREKAAASKHKEHKASAVWLFVMLN